MGDEASNWLRDFTAVQLIEGDQRARMTWVNTRRRNLERMVQAFGMEADRLLNHGDDLATLDRMQDSLVSEMGYIRRQLAAVVSARGRL